MRILSIPLIVNDHIELYLVQHQKIREFKEIEKHKEQ